MASSTSSFRISDELKSRLEEYLERHSRAALRAEARRQSLLASRKRWK